MSIYHKKNASRSILFKIYMYLCEIMNELSAIKSTPHMRLVYTLDIIILNACSMAIVYACLWKLDGLWAMLICNFTVLVLLRQYLFKLLQIHWLSSPLNRCLKRLTDIVCALVFLTTLFPIILFAYIILDIATRKKNGNPIFTTRKIQTKDNNIIPSVIFSQQLFAFDKACVIEKTPWAFNILLGNFSLWDIFSLKEDFKDISNTPTEANNSILEELEKSNITNSDTNNTESYVSNTTDNNI